ncbi:MAG: hypothetical protein Q8Q29_01525 [Actinomycetota bacterium]|nr:hypothetical protein [Actinomycetota bacterium]
MKRMFVVVAAIAVIGVGVYAFAGGNGEPAKPGTFSSQDMMGQMGGMMSGMPMRHPGERPLITRALEQREQLGLSADQVKALEAARAEFAEDAERRRADIEAAEQELGALLGQPAADLLQAEAKVRQIATLQADLRLARIRTLERGKAILTAEQRAKLLSEAHAGDGMMSGRGAGEMQRFMNSERAPQAMAAMMGMARGMGNGDTMLGMVRMMEMMGSMGGMMGGDGGGMMGGSPRRQATPKKAQ